jgi:thiamine-monophosphate kinase
MGLPDERALIAELTAHLDPDRNRAGFASDCAIVLVGEDELVATVDAFAQDTHFPEGLPPRSAGELAAGAALSDLAAAGAELLGVLAAYGVPDDIDTATLRGLAAGLADRVQAASGEVLGGDTKPRSELTLTLTALGTCPRGEAMTREQARPGQVLVLTGPLGGAGAGLDRIRAGMDPADASPLLPPDRLAAGRRLRRAGVRCAMDLSDGLADAAVAIAEASGVAVAIDAEAVPLHPWADDREQGLAHALSTGGDYELLAAVDRGHRERVVSDLEDARLDPRVVGRVTEGSGARLETAEGTRALDRGYEHRFA